ncbi:uncharacterized protein LOC119678550 [Teleopsis dalmanni]|uniref:uncharacterized protein LOC119678550 n=1 Tax=Teleopsis dalmanni TaxID=139649 RepID=UPI0018CC9A81|nr:uncharacterized protein LOC119678550 [Teleopsis dalmanni]
MGDDKDPSIQYLLLQHRLTKKNGQWKIKEKIKSDLSSQLLKKNLLVENKSTDLIHEIKQFANRQGNQITQRSNGFCKTNNKLKGSFDEITGKDEANELVTNNNLENFCGYGYVRGKDEDKIKNFDISKFKKEDDNGIKEHVINRSTENDLDYAFTGRDINASDTKASVRDNPYTASLDEDDTDGNCLNRDDNDEGSFDRCSLQGCSFYGGSFEGRSFDGYSTTEGNIYKSGTKTIRFDRNTSSKDCYDGNCVNGSTDDKNTVNEGTVDEGSLNKDGMDGGDFIVDCLGDSFNEILPNTDDLDRGGLDKVDSHHDRAGANAGDTHYNLDKIKETKGKHDPSNAD